MLINTIFEIIFIAVQLARILLSLVFLFLPFSLDLVLNLKIICKLVFIKVRNDYILCWWRDIKTIIFKE